MPAAASSATTSMVDHEGSTRGVRSGYTLGIWRFFQYASRNPIPYSDTQEYIIRLVAIHGLSASAEISVKMETATLKPLIEALTERRDLTRAEAETGMRAIIAGVDPCQTSAFLVLLRAKGETPSEVAGMVSVMREHMVRVDPKGTCVDIVGTGGDGHHTVNFSTAASVVAAACGAKVGKHGNRSVSSQCGSADVLEALGVVITQPPSGVEYCLEQAGISFMFAPGFHPAMKNVVPVRKALGVRTVFNILGPMLNPAACTRMLIGVYNEAMVELMAGALHQLGAELAMVVHCGGLDELAPIAVATVATVTPAGIQMGTIDPFLLGFSKCTLADLKGGTAPENAQILRDVLSGKLPGPVTDTVVLNAGAGLYVAGIAPSVEKGCQVSLPMTSCSLMGTHSPTCTHSTRSHAQPHSCDSHWLRWRPSRSSPGSLWRRSKNGQRQARQLRAVEVPR